MVTKDIYIIGASLYGEVVLELAEQCGYIVKGFFDDDPQKSNKKISDLQVIGTTKLLFSIKKNLEGMNFAVAIGHNKTRRTLLEKIREEGGITPNLIHKTAEISPSVSIGKGVYINAYSIIWTKVRIEDDCLFSPHVLISHHAVIQKGSFIANMSVVGAEVVVEKDVLVGMGSTIKSGVKTIGENSIIGAGSVVIHNVLPNIIVAGVPAKFIRNVEID